MQNQPSVHPQDIDNIKFHLDAYRDSFNHGETPEKRTEHYCGLHNALTPKVIEELLVTAQQSLQQATGEQGAVTC